MKGYVTLYRFNKDDMLRFENVENFVHEEWHGVIKFDYVSAGRRGRAVFYTGSLLGFTHIAAQA